METAAPIVAIRASGHESTRAANSLMKKNPTEHTNAYRPWRTPLRCRCSRDRPLIVSSSPPQLSAHYCPNDETERPDPHRKSIRGRCEQQTENRTASAYDYTESRCAKRRKPSEQAPEYHDENTCDSKNRKVKYPRNDQINERSFKRTRFAPHDVSSRRQYPEQDRCETGYDKLPVQARITPDP